MANQIVELDSEQGQSDRKSESRTSGVRSSRRSRFLMLIKRSAASSVLFLVFFFLIKLDWSKWLDIDLGLFERSCTETV